MGCTSCNAEVQFLPEQVLHAYFFCLLSSDLTGDVFKRLGRRCSILAITINVIHTKAQVEISVQCAQSQQTRQNHDTAVHHVIFLEILTGRSQTTEEFQFKS